MVQEQSPTDPFYHVTFTMMPHGWSWLRIVMNGKILDHSVSEIMRPAAQHMLGLCEAIIENEPASEPFYDGPGGHVWRLAPVKKQRHVMHLEIFEVSPLRGFDFREADLDDPVISLVVERRLFLMLLMAELWKNALLCKDPSYQKDRSHFPWKEFRQITQKWDQSALGPSLAPLP